MLNAVERKMEALVRIVALLGGAGFLVAILVTCLSIAGKILRRILNTLVGAEFDPTYLSWARPILGEEELVQYAVGIGLFAALPWVTMQRGHITVDLLKNRFSKTVNSALDLIGSVTFSVVIYMIMTQQWFLVFKKTPHAQSSLFELLYKGNWGEFASRVRTMDESQILGMKLWPIHTIAELCVILLFAVSVLCVFRCFRNLQDARRGVDTQRP